MPEPEVAATEVARPPTPPIEPSSSRASFASCPPEDERELHIPRAARAELRVPQSPGAGSAIEEDGDVSSDDGLRTAMPDVRQEPTPEPEAQLGAQREDEDDGEKKERETNVRMVGGLSDTSAEGSPEARGHVEMDPSIPQPAGDEKKPRADAGDDAPGPLYMSYPPEQREKHPQAWSSFLHPGSKFRGTQQSDRQVYDVQVEIKDVDLTESSLCGYLRIQGLTDDHPTLTTFFEGEIIGPKHLFRTTHPSWNSSEKIDLQHWARFPAFRPLAKAARSSPSTFTLKTYLDREHLFMRWKEYFLVPDHRVKSISGASFEGFYYICFDQVGGGVSGIYFHAKSEKYQQLELQHVRDGGCVGAVQFR